LATLATLFSQTKQSSIGFFFRTHPIEIRTFKSRISQFFRADVGTGALLREDHCQLKSLWAFVLEIPYLDAIFGNVHRIEEWDSSKKPNACLRTGSTAVRLSMP
jgi:hypothetical protein